MIQNQFNILIFLSKKKCHENLKGSLQANKFKIFFFEVLINKNNFKLIKLIY